MIQQKKAYMSGILAIILLASPSAGRASSYWEKVKSGAGSAYDTAKSWAPYAPAAAFTALAANDRFGSGSGSNFLPLLGLATAAATKARANQASQEEGGGYNNYLSNIAPYIAPIAAAAGVSALTGDLRMHHLPEIAMIGGGLAAPIYGLSKGRQMYHSSQFEKIKDQIKNLVYNILDKNLTNDPIKDKEAYLFNNNDLLKLILDYNAYFPYVDMTGKPEAKLKDAHDFIKQVAIDYINKTPNAPHTKIYQQIFPIEITDADTNFFDATEKIEGYNQPSSMATENPAELSSSSS